MQEKARRTRMKIDIVTPYGNNRFDLDVNKVTALIQMAYKYSELGRENMLEESKPETLQEAVAAAWGVVAEKEMEKIKEIQEPSEMANSDVHRAPKKDGMTECPELKQKLEEWRCSSVKIWPRKKSDRRGYACMPLKKNVPEGKQGWKLVQCPECGEWCWRSPLVEKAEKLSVIALCTECALWKGVK